MGGNTYNLLTKLRRQLKEITPFKEKINKYFLGFRNYKYYFSSINWRQDYIFLSVLDFNSKDIITDKNIEFFPKYNELVIKMYSKEDIKKYLPLIKNSKRYNESGTSTKDTEESSKSDKEKSNSPSVNLSQ